MSGGDPFWDSVSDYVAEHSETPGDGTMPEQMADWIRDDLEGDDL